MAADEKKVMDHLLASRPGMKLRNIKFCRGDRAVITAQEFAEQVCKVVDQTAVEPGSQKPAQTGLAPIDVRRLVADIA
jgi:hypothetical protein